MTARVSSGWAYHGLNAVILENAAIRVTVLPELGGHVLELFDKALDRNLLWSNPRTLPRRAPYGAHFDDWWSGGWDEIFPTGDRALLHEELLPYMGETWSVPWEAATGVGDGAAWVGTTGHATIAPARLERTLRLDGDAPVLRASYRITNLDVRPLPFLWGIHPSFAVTADHRIDLPGSSMLVGVSSDPLMGEVGSTYTWTEQPVAGGRGVTRDVRVVLPPEAAVFGGHWATDLAAGWLALTDTASRRGIAIVFPRAVFPHAWLWQVYGGWRGHHHLCLEPWTGYPMQLEEAQAAGRARVLQPGDSLEAEVVFALFEGLDGVSSVEADGAGFAIR
jgi:hypothetical protein